MNEKTHSGRGYSYVLMGQDPRPACEAPAMCRPQRTRSANRGATSDTSRRRAVGYEMPTPLRTDRAVQYVKTVRNAPVAESLSDKLTYPTSASACTASIPVRVLDCHVIGLLLTCRFVSYTSSSFMPATSYYTSSPCCSRRHPPYVYRCSPRHPPHSVPVLATPSTS